MAAISKESIIELLKRNDAVGRAAVNRALVLLYKRQTKDEIKSRETKIHNNRGFSPFDAEIMTSCAIRILNGYELSDAQYDFVTKLNPKGVPRIGKYWRQLLEEAELKQNRKLNL